MAERFKYDLFLSHSGRDKAIVRPLAERLRGDGLKVWFDEWEIMPGDSIPAKIEEGLEQSCVLVLCMSANAFGSDWAQLESQTFRFRDPLNKERRFIPLRLDDASIKGTLAQFLYIDWRATDSGQEYAKLLQSCQNPGSWPASSNETPPESKQGTYVLVLSGSVPAMHHQRVEAILNHLRAFSDDLTLTLESLEEGSVRFLLKGTYAGYERLRNLQDSGRLTQELAIEVMSLGLFEHIQPEDARLAETAQDTNAQTAESRPTAAPQPGNIGQLDTDGGPASMSTGGVPNTLSTDPSHSIPDVMTTIRIRQRASADGKHDIDLTLKRSGQPDLEADARIEFALTPQEQEELRWYMEDYLQRAESVEAVQVEQIEQWMKRRGVELYTKVLAANLGT